MRNGRRVLGVTLSLGLVLAACGGTTTPSPGASGEPPASTEPSEGGTGGGTIIHGTTDPPSSYDPSGSYDLPSWNVIYNVMEGLLAIPPGGDSPEPVLAESCEFEDAQTYTCTLKEGVTFHDGSPFTADDVKFSLDRSIQIADENSGAYTLLAALSSPDTFTGDEVEVVDDFTVTFHLNTADATFPFILTTGAAYIVPDETYPADAIQPNDTVVGTGRYQLVEYRSGEQTVLERFDGYHGEPANNERVIIQQFSSSSALKLAVEQGDVDIAYRLLTPTEIADLQGQDGLSVVEGNGTEIRYMVFNTALEPGDELAVRKAVASLVDREAIATNVYNGTVEPLYSQVPRGLPGHIDAFADLYGESPDPDAAEQFLEDAGIATPVEIEVWFTPSRYGESSADEYAEIKRALEDSGLFTVALDSTEWEQYRPNAFGDERIYPAFQLGWFPDFPDADNYLAPFFTSSNFLNNGYSNERVDELVAIERESTSEDDRIAAFEEIQEIVADEAPIIPIWQGKQVAVVRDGITGVEDTFDPSFIFRYWLFSKAE